MPPKIPIKQFMTTTNHIFGPNFHHLFATIIYYFVISKKNYESPLCFVCMDTFLKEESGYPIRDFASCTVTEQTFLLPQDGSILTPQLLGIEPGAWLDTKQPRGPRQIGIQSTPGGTRVCARLQVES